MPKNGFFQKNNAYFSLKSENTIRMIIELAIVPITVIIIGMSFYLLNYERLKS